MKNLMIPAALGAALTACTPAIYEVPGVVEKLPSEVANCERVGRVTGKPGVFGPLAEIGLQDARRAAEQTAKEAGANTIVYDPLPEGEVYELPATVYKC
ncbi:hypothetical protein C8N43_0277 [Litoreibacter ponti]|uniref:DUF4156 domain-containing protein n=1 Tax=Litoreibacter ponti TaxID=1510457 RepID=A0A2T6BHU5_9RHOB|nr:hypothetical protein [Litoreibacter ponti]PTX55638.1 hypothetical protein C8N43_0277 [Litoreibacter ponti]